jgi:hypothetical protein
MNRMEERMQMLEVLFKAYYVDDEVFRSLDNVSKFSGADERHVDSTSIKYSDYDQASSPQTEKLFDNDCSNTTSKSNSDRLTLLGRQNTDQQSSSEVFLTQIKHTSTNRQMGDS